VAIEVADIVEVSLVTVMDGVAAVNVMHFEVLDTGSAATDTDLVNELLLENLRDVFLETIWDAAVVNSITATCAKAQKIFPVREAAFLRSLSVNGTIVDDHLPVSCVCMTSHRSFKSDPNKRGATARNYWSGLAETFTGNGRLTTEGALLFLAVANYFTPVLAAGTAQFRRVVYAGTLQAPDPQTFDVAVSFADPIIRKLRGRTARVCPV